MSYISLHNHTMYSVMSSIIKPGDLMKRAAELGMSSVAITDNFSLGGIWDAYKLAKANKVKLIVGCQFFFVDSLGPFADFNNKKAKDKPKIPLRPVILIAKNMEGYRNLLRMNIKSFDCKAGKIPLIDWSLLQQYNAGNMCLTSDASGILGQRLSSGEFDKAEEDLKKLIDIFGKEDVILELEPNNLKYNDCDQFTVNRGVYNLSKKFELLPVAASNARYLVKEHFKAHDLVLAIKSGRALSDRSRPRFELDQLYLHTQDEIVKFFKRNYGEEFANQLCENTLAVADKCEQPDWVKPEVITGDKAQLPEFPVKDEGCYDEFKKWIIEQNDEVKQLPEDKQYLRYLCSCSWNKLPSDNDEEYKKRLNDELNVFEIKDFSSYMLITQDFLNFGRKNNIPIGPGRGSVGGSLIGNLTDIHNANPIKFGLIFERFLNLSKNFPDIDSDMDSEGREKILEYVSNKYGKDFVAHVSNYNTFTVKVAVTDVITALEIGGNRSDAFKLAKNLTETFLSTVRTVDEAMTQSKLFEEFIKEHPEVQELATLILGIIRSRATHAAGVVIGKYSLHGLVPLRLDEKGVVVLEWEKERTEENGLVKIDFLGLETLNIIKNTYKIIDGLNKSKPEEFDCNKYYPEAYQLISDADTFCIFQLGGSSGTAGLCNKIEPHNLEDLAIINSLARPGVPAEIKQSFIDRKFGREEVVIPHPNLERAVGATYGYCIFEESFLWLAHDFCGWDLAKSDKMRKISKLKAKGKKILEELEVDFVKSAVAHSNVAEDFAQNIWDEWVIPLSGYAFNKSHAILYSMTSLHTAFLKAYYFNEFMTANLISETNSNAPTAKGNILKIKQELRKKGVKIYTPDLNKSETNYRLIEEDKLITGFSSLRGVKAPAAENIMVNRPFSSFEDFLYRTDTSKVRAQTVRALIACGALDSFGYTRKSMYLYCSDLRKKYKVWKTKNPDKPIIYELPKEEWSMGELRALESHYIGEAISGSKKDSFPKLFSGHRAVSKIKEAMSMADKTEVVIEAEVVDLFVFKVKKQESKIFGQECCRMLLEDLASDQIGIVFFPQIFDFTKTTFQNEFNTRKFEKGFGIRVAARVSHYNGEVSLVATDVYGLFEPVDMPSDLEPKKIAVTTIKKKAEDTTTQDFEDDLLTFIK